jgi:exosortase
MYQMACAREAIYCETSPLFGDGRIVVPTSRRFDAIFVAVLVLVWIPGIVRLAGVWSEVEYASHGFLVPLAALWAATAHRAELAQLDARRPTGGSLLVLLAAVAYLGALLLHDATVLGLVAVATIVMAVFVLRGRAWVGTLRFSLAYLLFMVPLPVAWVTPLIVQLQLGMSQVAVAILQSAGVAILREGNVLTLPGDVSLFVAEACSGITSLITLLPIGVLIAYFTESVAWRRWVLVLAVIPIALAGNLLRVIGTVWLAIKAGVEAATTGPIHEWTGVGTYVFGCACLLSIGALMRWLIPPSYDEAGS